MRSQPNEESEAAEARRRRLLTGHDIRVEAMMKIAREYFLTLSTALAFVLICICLYVNEHLQQVTSHSYGALLIKIATKIDQLIFVLLTGAAIALVSVIYVHHRADKMKYLLFPLLIALMPALLAKGKFENIGTDSFTEVIQANMQETRDFVKLYLLHIKLSALDYLILLTPLILIPIHAVVSRHLHVSARIRDVKISLLIVGCLYGIVTLSFAYALVDGNRSIEEYQEPLQKATLSMLGSFGKHRAAPNIVVYIGESTPRENLGIYGYHIDTSAALNDLRDDLIVFSDVITPYSHTFPALYRAFSVSADPYADQFLPIKDLKRANSIWILNHFGYESHWLSNQNIASAWDWASKIFGMQARHSTFLNIAVSDEQAENRRYDTELIEAYRRTAAGLTQPDQIVFLHSYAGHFDYCKNIPETERKPRDNVFHALPAKAVYGDLYIDDIDRHRRTIDCFDSAMSFIAKNLRAVIGDIARQPLPTVFIYFSDHGEDVFAGTGHDSSNNSFRHIEIPFIVYFNPAAQRQFPALYEAALLNKDKPYSIEWLADSILDLAGISNAQRKPISVFSKENHVPDRYALRRTDIRRNHSIIAVDQEDASARLGLLSSGHDFFRKRRLVHSLPPAEAGKICAYRSNSLLKYIEASGIFKCIVVNIMIDARNAQLYIHSPPQKSNGLALNDLIRLGGSRSGRLLLDLSNPDDGNVDFLVDYLDGVFEKNQRADVVLQLPLSDRIGDSALAKLRGAGYKLSYKLPEEASARCSHDAATRECGELGKKVAAMLGNPAVDGIVFDVAAFRFVDALQLKHPVEFGVHDVSVDGPGDVRMVELHRSSSYAIPYYSAFDY